MALIEEAGANRDFRQRESCLAHHHHRITQTAPHPVFSRRAAEHVAESSGEVDRVYFELLRDLGDLHRVAESVVQKFPRLAYPWCMSFFPPKVHS